MVPVEYGGSHVLHVKPKHLIESTLFDLLVGDRLSRDGEGLDSFDFRGCQLRSSAGHAQHEVWPLNTREHGVSPSSLVASLDQHPENEAELEFRFQHPLR